jgi:hypothetical protein
VTKVPDAVGVSTISDHVGVAGVTTMVAADTVDAVPAKASAVPAKASAAIRRMNG